MISRLDRAALRAEARRSSVSTRTAHTGGHRWLQGASQHQRGRLRRGRGAGRRRRAGAARGRAPRTRGHPRPAGLPYVVASLRRPDGLRARRRRTDDVPGRREQRHRGCRGRRYRRSSCRCRSATASRRSTPGRSSTPGERCWSATPSSRARGYRDTCPALATDPDRLAAMSAAASGLIPRDADEKLAADRSSRRSGMRSRCRRGRCRRTELGRVHLVGIGDAGLSAIARLLLARGIHGQRQRRRRVADLDALRALGATVHVGHDAAQRRRRRHRGRLHRGQRGQPRVRRGARARPPGDPAFGRDGRGDGRPPGGRGGRHPRQDHDDRAAHRRPSRRPAPTRRTPSAATSPPPGVNAAEGSGDLFVAEADESDAPSSSTARTPRSSPTSRPTTSTTGGPKRPTPRRSRRSRNIDPDGFLVCCVDDAGAAALAERQRAGRSRVGRRLDPRGGRPTSGPEGARRRAALWSPGDHYLADALAAWPPGLMLGLTRTTGPWHRRLHRHPAPDGAQGRGRRHPGLRQLCAPPDRDRRRPAAARALAGEGRVVVAFQPHLASRTRVFGAAMGEALGAADEVVVCDVYLSREDPDPERDRRTGRGRRTAAARAGRLRADLADVAGRARRPGAPRRPGAHPRGRRRHRGRPAGARAASRRRCVACGGHRTDRHRRPARTRRSRRRFARRQWRRRWLAWRYLLALVLVLALVGRRVWRGLVLVLAGGRDRRRQRRPDRRGLRHPGALGHRRRRAAGPGRPRPRPSAGSARWPWSGRSTVTRQWPNGILVSIEERVAIAVVEIGGRLRGMDADGVVFRDYKKAPPGLPRVETSIGTTSEALGRRPR